MTAVKSVYKLTRLCCGGREEGAAQHPQYCEVQGQNIKAHSTTNDARWWRQSHTLYWILNYEVRQSDRLLQSILSPHPVSILPLHSETSLLHLLAVWKCCRTICTNTLSRGAGGYMNEMTNLIWIITLSSSTLTRDTDMSIIPTTRYTEVNVFFSPHKSSVGLPLACLHCPDPVQTNRAALQEEEGFHVWQAACGGK